MALTVVNFEPHGLDRTRKIVNLIFLGAGRLKHLQFLGERKGFANQPAIHLAGNQVGELNVAGVLP
jgi:hypothetical protein